MAKRKLPPMAPEELARRAEITRMFEKRMAERLAIDRKLEEAQARTRPGRFRRALRELLTP